METHCFTRNRAVPRWIAVPAAALLFLTACNRMEDSNTNFTEAIDVYYKTHPSCLFAEPVKFPAEADPDDRKQRTRYDALVDQNLLTRSTGEKQVMVVAEKQVNSYDLSSTGHTEWVADSQQPGYGNLCYGHRKVLAIDSSTPTASTEGATTTVVYRYTVKDVAAWAKAPGMLAAFPGLMTDLTGRQVGRATLTDTKQGWEVTTAPWAHIDDSDIYK